MRQQEEPVTAGAGLSEALMVQHAQALVGHGDAEQTKRPHAASLAILGRRQRAAAPAASALALGVSSGRSRCPGGSRAGSPPSAVGQFAGVLTPLAARRDRSPGHYTLPGCHAIARGSSSCHSVIGSTAHRAIPRLRQSKRDLSTGLMVRGWRAMPHRRRDPPAAASVWTELVQRLGLPLVGEDPGARGAR